MHKPVKYVEKGLSIAANGAWVDKPSKNLESAPMVDDCQ